MPSKKKYVKNIWEVIVATFKGFRQDKVLKLSASLAYYTVFALPALALVLISVTGIFFGEDAMSGIIYKELHELIGKNAATQIQEAIKNTHLAGTSYAGTILGVITLLLSATGIFGEIQDSINRIWGLQAKPKRGIIKLLLNRIMSFSLILSLGFAMLVSLIINGILAALKEKLQAEFPGLNVNLLLLVDYAIQLITITYLFAIIFKILPDAKIKWRDVTIGALVTTLLFLVGKSLLAYFIARNASIEAYGAAGSIILILLWAYYSSAILYLGAEFTQVYAKKFGSDIQPNKYASWVEIQTVEVTAPPTEKGRNIK
ncbi:MAG: YihY/virulence factor BrkB family protein [Bacteroidetes bacterium]|jgi:membrane protein|nr:YihY/virulence factor BrkB family protein [Bacteroidota bacterium]